MERATGGRSGPSPDEEIILEVLQMLRLLDDTPPGQMNGIFYQHWFEELNIATRALLRILGREPDS